MTDRSYVCSDCGKEHEGLPTDWAFKLPDTVFELPLLDRYRRTRSSSDLCTLDECRFFIRGILAIPFTYQDGEFSWGVWVEVDRATHDFYLTHFHEDFAQGTNAKGRLANAIPGFPELVDPPLDIEFHDSATRPSFSFVAASVHPLASDQRGGIDFSRHHDFLALCGHFNESDG